MGGGRWGEGWARKMVVGCHRVGGMRDGKCKIRWEVKGRRWYFHDWGQKKSCCRGVFVRRTRRQCRHRLTARNFPAALI